MEQYDVIKLVEKWSQAKGKMSIADVNDRFIQENLAVLLENQKNKDLRKEILGEAASHGTGTTGANIHQGQDGAFSPIALALVRRTFPELFAHKIVGVQAMTGPVGLAYALRVQYDDDSGNEAAWDEVPKYSGYSGSTRGTSGTADGGTGVDTSAAEAWNIQTATTMPELKMKIDKTAIEAKSRKLAASFSLEAAQDIKAMHGVDMEREMVNVLQYEIQAELDRELLARVKTVATTGTAIDLSAVDGRWSQERLGLLATKIVKEANSIASRTRRGPGNFVVVSTDVATALQSLQNGRFTANVQAVNPTNTFAEIGLLNGTLKVYRDTYNTDNQVVVGYKGPGVSDAGVIFSPYIMGLFNRAIAQEDFSPRVGVMSRYAITNTLLGASRYYTKFSVTNLSTAIPA